MGSGGNKKPRPVDFLWPARYCTRKNLQECIKARVSWVVHRDTTTAIINQTLKVEEAKKHTFTGIWDKKTDKNRIEELGECDHWAKRMKALDDHESIAKQSEYTLV